MPRSLALSAGPRLDTTGSPPIAPAAAIDVNAAAVKAITDKAAAEAAEAAAPKNSDMDDEIPF